MGAVGTQKARAYRLDLMVDELENAYRDASIATGNRQT